MAEGAGQVWTYRAVFVFLIGAVIFSQLLPLHPGPGQMGGPDVILLIALSWIVMRPDFVPVLLLAAVFLMADLLLMRPPGLWTALAVIAGEFLRHRQLALRAASFPVEWALIAGVITAMVLVNALVLGIFGVTQPSLGQTILRLIFTIVAYPIVVILAGRAFGLKKRQIGETDRFGHRI
ncbi:MAG: rod shape-determining protein MreD [Silicimonas sp.]|nr:rod shape-determining protein MreD [Silicimonas sp.]